MSTCPAALFCRVEDWQEDERLLCLTLKEQGGPDAGMSQLCHSIADLLPGRTPQQVQALLQW